MNNLKTIKNLFLIYLLFSFFITGCSSTSLERRKTDPNERRKIEEQLKTKEDWEYWNKIKGIDPFIIIDDEGKNNQ